ncbi:hypothetical protein [Actinoplanes sp. NPDC049118]|uniref:hypothetical protein n=1 Tax=Actinoplanes sp. NPDC049118 TaxID=3155769 RepID=UPI0033EF2FDB
MDGVVDYGRFAQRLAACTDRAGRWALLAQFEREWGVTPQPSEIFSWIDDLVDEDLEGVDAHLPVPAALDEWLRLPATSYTDEPHLYWSYLIYPPRVEEDEDDDLEPDDPILAGATDLRMVRFLGRAFSDSRWGYPAALAGQADPPVVHSDLSPGSVQSRSLSEFVVHLAVMRLPWRHGFAIEVPQTTPELDAALDGAGLPQLGLPPWEEDGYWSVEVYGAPDAIVYRYPGEVVWAVGRTRQALRDLAARIDPGWKPEITAAHERDERHPSLRH